MTGGLTFDPWGPPAVIVVAAVAVLALLWLRRRPGWPVRAGIVLLLALAVAGPQLGADAVVFRERPDIQVLVALDRTASMAVADQDGSTRLASAVADLDSLLSEDSPVSVVTWGRSARQVVPFTSDTHQVARTLALVHAEPPTGGTGSRVDVPLTTLRGVARRAGAADLYVLVLTDGENTQPGRPRSYAALGRLADGGAVIGYGSPEGGPVPLGPGRSGFAPAPDGSGPAISRRDDAELQRVAAELGVPYVARDRVDSQDELGDLLVPPLREVPGPTVHHDVTWAVGLLLLLLVLWEVRAATFTTAEALRMRTRS